jgi:1-phosphofructokinase family hexose kinase
VTLSHGGKAINAAYTARLLGVAVRVSGFIGGASGQALVEHLHRFGVTTDFVSSCSPTRCCTTLVDLSQEEATELVEEAATPGADDWAVLETKIRGALPSCRLLVAAGALPPNAPPVFYAHAARLAAEAGRALLLDTRGAALLAALAHQPLLVKLNRAELAQTLHRTLDLVHDLANATRELVAQGARWALVTDGPQPAWLATREGQLWRVTPPAVQACNAVGSGDAVLGGVGAALARGAPMLDAIAQGIACGSAAALTLTPGELDPVTVQRLTQQVDVSGQKH